MKKIQFLFAMCSICLCLPMGQLSSQYRLSDLHARALAATSNFEKEGLEIVKTQFDILTLSKSSETINRFLSADFTYYIRVFSDGAIDDLDLYLYQGSGDELEVLAKENGEGNIATISFKPPTSKAYNLYIKADQFANDEAASHYVLIVSHDLPDRDNTSNSSTSTTGTTFVFESTTKTISRITEDEEADIISSDKIESRFVYKDNIFQHTINGQEITYTIYEQDSEGKLLKWEGSGSDGKDYVIHLNLDSELILIMAKGQRAPQLVFFYDISRSYKEE